MVEHDPAALRSLAERSPEIAAQHLASALASAPPDAGGALDETAVTLVARLRRSGQLAAALRLAGAGAHRSARLRIEQALAAFALGEDVEAARIADAHPEVKRIVGPLLDATRGTRLVMTTSKASSAPLRALHTAAAAVSTAVRGEPGPARALLRRIAPAQRRAVMAAELGAAIDLESRPGGKSLTSAIRLLQDVPRVRLDPQLQKALIAQAAEAAPEAALEAGRSMGLAAEVMRPAVLRTFMKEAEQTDVPPEQAALQLVRRTGIDAFDGENRATASLYEGFAWMQADPERATRAFDRAIELGADLAEALRGKLVLAMSTTGGVCADCGARHRGSGREAAKTADHLARVLARSPLAAPLVAAVSTVAAEGWASAGDNRAARASLAVARANAGGSAIAEIDLLEAHVLAQDQPARARALVDELLAKDPGHLAAWRMKLSLAERQHDKAVVDALVLQAAEATRDPALTAKARVIRGQRGELTPFGGLVPGIATAGAVAAELFRVARAAGTATGALTPGAVACRDALTPAAQLAFDAVTVGLAAKFDGPKAGQARLTEVIRAWRSSPAALAKLAATSWLVGLEDALLDIARELLAGPEIRAHRATRANEDTGPALAALAEAALAAADVRIAEKLIALGAVEWPRSEVMRMKHLLAELKRRERDTAEFPFIPLDGPAALSGLSAKDPGAAGYELDALLGPEFSFLDALSAGKQGGDNLVLRELLEAVGIPAEALAQIPAAELRDLEARVLALADRDDMSPKVMVEIMKILQQILGDEAFDAFAGGPPRRAPRRVHAGRRRRR